jgi:DedD protein
MEKKKLLLVAVSVGVFLVIAVSAAILFFKPGTTAPSEVLVNTMPNRSATTDAADLVRDDADAYRGLQNPASISPIQENRIYINGEPGSEMAVEHSDETGSTKTVINIPQPTTAAVPAVPARPTAAAPTRPQPAAPARPAAPAQTSTAVPAQTTVAATARSAYNDFWVQAGSFSTRERADGVKNTLDTKGIAAIITNQEINGNTYYRVRVGPYTSQNEADYWLAMIKSIDGFQDSQVWESRSMR